MDQQQAPLVNSELQSSQFELNYLCWFYDLECKVLCSSASFQ